jgi:hypothetical protein
LSLLFQYIHYILSFISLIDIHAFSPLNSQVFDGKGHFLSTFYSPALVAYFKIY